jgi:molecular chaperone GrpE
MGEETFVNPDLTPAPETVECESEPPPPFDPGPDTEEVGGFVIPSTGDDTVVGDLGPVPSASEPDASTPPEAEGDAGELIRTLGASLERRLDQIQTLIEREARAEATREKVVDRLHAELQEYKQDLLLNTLRPVFVDLIQLHDDIGKVAVAPSDAEVAPEVGRLLGLMRGFQQGIEDILYRQGVEPFHADGDSFDPRRQRAVSTVPTDDPSLNKQVAARLRKGFRAGEKVIRPEIVSVYAVGKARE